MLAIMTDVLLFAELNKLKKQEKIELVVFSRLSCNYVNIEALLELKTKLRMTRIGFFDTSGMEHGIVEQKDIIYLLK